MNKQEYDRMCDLLWKRHETVLTDNEASELWELKQKVHEDNLEFLS